MKPASRQYEGKADREAAATAFRRNRRVLPQTPIPPKRDGAAEAKQDAACNSGVHLQIDI